MTTKPQLHEADRHTLAISERGGPRGRPQYRCEACGQSVWLTSDVGPEVISFLEEVHQNEVRVAASARAAEEVAPEPLPEVPEPPATEELVSGNLPEFLNVDVELLRETANEIALLGHDHRPSTAAIDNIRRAANLIGTARLRRPAKPDVWYAPFTDEQVAQLLRWQTAGFVHPFTCASEVADHPSGVMLVPARAGWICPLPTCGFTQNWAHSYMADGTLPDNPWEMP